MTIPTQLLLEQFDHLFSTPESIAPLRQAILELAVRGKLVPQDPHDEPASDLAKQNRDDRLHLIEQKIVNKNILDTVMNEGKIPFSVPTSWQWVSLAEVAYFERGITFPASAKEEIATRENIACLRTANVQEQVNWSNLIYVSPSYITSEEKKIRLHDVLISMANSYELVGKVSFVEPVPVEATFGGFIAALRSFCGVYPKYLYYCLKSNAMQVLIHTTASQTINIANISLGGMYPLPFPLPPLPEQHHIVARVEELMRLCDALQAKLTVAQDERERLTAALLAGIG